MIFVSGIHGVGKTYFCNVLKRRLGIEAYSASQLIAEKKKQPFSANKYISNIDENQFFLLEAVHELREEKKEFILDGHFCLLDANGAITRISREIFAFLKPDMLLLLTEDPVIIAERRFQRDGVRQELSEIISFQEAEKLYAIEIATELRIPLEIMKGAEDIERMIAFVETGGK